MIKALLIAPYSGLARTAEKMDVPMDIEFDIKVANLQEGVEMARLAEQEEYDVIISRGGTAALIQEAVSIPVVHIDISGYDMLRVFTLIRDIKEEVALVGFENITQGAATLCNILELDVHVVTIQSGDEVGGRLKQLKSQGYDVVIGDVITIQVAEQIGMRGVLITSGKEALMDALEEGKRVCRLFDNLKKQFYFLQESYRSIPFPIVMLNKDNEVIDKNISFQRDMDDEQLLQEPEIIKMVQNVRMNETSQWTECSRSQYKYVVQGFPANKTEQIVGLVIHEIKRLNHEQSVYIERDLAHVPIIGESGQANRLRGSITTFAKVNEAICIFGEKGTGKQTIAKEIHLAKHGPLSPLVIVECSRITPQEITEWKHHLLAMRKGSLLLKDVDEIPVAVQGNFLELLLSTRLQILALSSTPLDTLVAQEKFSKGLYERIVQQTLHVLPLRQRKEDIPGFVNYFLTELHAENGNETLGVKPDAMDLLKSYEWEGNISQLKRFIRELSLMTDGNYIELAQVRNLAVCLNEMKDQAYSDNLPVSGTLKEMEQQMIQKVLQEEGNNQSRAAKRLGINRSTLWRKLHG